MADARAVYQASMTETDHQGRLFTEIRAHERHVPALALAFHCPSEGKRTPGYRHALALQGLKAGIPDVILPVATGPFGGCAIELKIKPNTPTAAQRWWLTALAGQGWYTCVCYGWEAAWLVVQSYLGMIASGDQDVNYRIALEGALEGVR